MEPQTVQHELEKRINAGKIINHPYLLERFVYRNGVYHPVSPTIRDIKPGVPKHCFSNATHLMFEYMSEGFEYYEGFAIRTSLYFPIHHAWIVHDGLVIDNTWNNPEDCVYFGVHIPMFDVIEQTNRTGYYGVLVKGGSEMLNLNYMKKRDPGMFDEIKAEFGIDL